MLAILVMGIRARFFPVLAILFLVALNSPVSASDAIPSGPVQPAYQPLISGEVLHANTVEIANLTLSDVTAKPTLANKVLTFHDCSASAYGGSVTGTTVIDFIANTNRCVLDIKDVDLATMLGDFGLRNDNLGGKISGHIELLLPIGQVNQMSGHGTLSVRDGSLMEMSLLTSLLVGEIQPSRGKDSAEANFDVSGGAINISSCQITAPSTRLSISGKVLLDGTLNLLIIPRVDTFLGKIPWLGKPAANVMNWTSSKVARVVVRGNVSRPVVVMNPFAE